jgi:hypothetical protein
VGVVRGYWAGRHGIGLGQRKYLVASIEISSARGFKGTKTVLSSLQMVFIKPFCLVVWLFFSTQNGYEVRGHTTCIEN